MRYAPILAAALAAGAASAVNAADLPQSFEVSPPVVVEDLGNLCVIDAPGGSLEVYEEPRGEVWGNLPNGMIVEVMDTPFTPRTDLWVRIKPPRLDDYYGWVATASFVCV